MIAETTQLRSVSKMKRITRISTQNINSKHKNCNINVIPMRRSKEGLEKSCTIFETYIEQIKSK